MKFKFRADAQDVLIFAMFAIFLLYVVALGTVNLHYLSNGDDLTLLPIEAFGPEFLSKTLLIYLVALGALFLSVQSYFFEREEGVGFSLGKKDKGYSRWAKDKEMKAVLKEVDPQAPSSEYAGIPLISKNGKLWVDNGEYHTLVIGATGAGKTQSTILPAIQCLAKKGESMILTDPKGELYEGTGELLKSKGYDIIVLNFRSPQKGNAWNPMTLPYRLYTSGNKDKAIELLDDLALNILYEENSGNSDPFWEKTSADYFSGLALGLFEDAPEEKININSISLTTTVGEEKCGGSTYVKEYFNLKDPNSPAYINASGTIMAPNETKGSIISVFKQKVKLFSSRENLSEMLSYSDFDLRTIGERPTAVFIIIQDEKKTYHSLATIFIKQCYETLIDVAQEHGGKLPCRTNFLLDEFANMPPLKDVTTMITAARSRQVRFTMIIQNFAQLTQVYGKENAETIKGNCGNIVYLISTELSALEEISKLCGEVKSKKDDKTASTPLVTVSDLQRMKQFDQIVLRLRMQPFKTSFTPNFKINWGNQKFPKMGYVEREKRPVQVFDVREFVKEKRQEKIREMMMENNSSSSPAPSGGGIMSTATPLIPNNESRPQPASSSSSGGNQAVDIDDLVRKIDAKIAEIEKEEKAKNNAAKQDKPVQTATSAPSSGLISSKPSSSSENHSMFKAPAKEEPIISNESIENKVNEIISGDAFNNSKIEEKMDNIDRKVEETIIKPETNNGILPTPQPTVEQPKSNKPTISLDDIDENQFFDDFFED